MSISIDDLVSSLNTSHIGQEALDLAALQAQLAQTLAQAIQHSTNGQAKRETRPYACNTPTAHTPSTSLSFAEAQRYFDSMTRRNSHSDEGSFATEQTEEDERMVEDLLLPQTPMSPSGTTSFEQQHYYTQPPSHSHHYKTYTSPFAAESFPNSTFTSTDPFYQQAVKSHGFNASPASVFTQGGRPSHHSPFITTQKQK